MSGMEWSVVKEVGKKRESVNTDGVGYGSLKGKCFPVMSSVYVL